VTDPRALLRAYGNEVSADYLPDGTRVDVRHQAAPAVFAALEAVLDKHSPDPWGECNECVSDAEGEPMPWPCPTVRAITTELTKET
jgi:hypothetical protein